jgi:hypothetical protein
MINSYGNVILPSDTKINKQNYTMYYIVFPIINHPERKLHCRQETVMRRERERHREGLQKSRIMDGSRMFS